jgi:hypothetical protein
MAKKKLTQEERPAAGTLTKEFEIVSGKVRITDPCYDTSTWCSTEVDKVKNGKWNAFVTKSDEGDWGMRCAVLEVWHSDYKKEVVINDNMKYIDADIGVDSGQAGIFDSKFYKNEEVANKFYTEKGTGRPFDPDDLWYSLSCDQTLGEEQWGAIPYGAVSSSGYGDGSYRAYKTEIGGEIVAIKIIFIGDEEMENEDSDE